MEVVHKFSEYNDFVQVGYTYHTSGKIPKIKRHEVLTTIV